MPGSATARGQNGGPTTVPLSERVRPPNDRRDLRLLTALAWKTVRIIWRVAPRELSIAVTFQVAVAIATAVQLAAARQVLAKLMPNAGDHVHVGAVVPYFAALVAATVTVAFATTIQKELTLLIGELLGRRATDDVAEVAAAVDLESFEQYAFYDGLERAHFNATNRHLSTAADLLGLTQSVLAALAIAATLLVVAPLVVPLAIAGALPGWVVSSRNSRRLHDFETSMTAKLRERRYLLESLADRDAAKEIRAFDIGELLRIRHNQLYDRYISRMRALVSARLRSALLADVIGLGAIVVALGLLLWLIAARWLTLADAGTAVFGILFLADRMRLTVIFAGRFYEAALFVEDITAFAARQPVLSAPEVRTPAPRRFASLAVEHLAFTYPGASKPALRDVSLEIAAGEVVALVGENGSGKTTLAKQLAALHRPTSGRILWDGLDVTRCDPRELRQAIAVIFQDFVRWALSADENIAFGQRDAIDDRDAIVDAARRAGAHEFLSRLPDGYRTMLSSLFAGGHDLSTGQWQRVALARALFRDAPFVIMDEPTAALDPLAEYRVFEAIRTALQGRSLLFISHRFSSVRMADRIFVLHEGVITEHGSHEELMALDGHYARMFTLQASAYLAPALAKSTAPRGNNRNADGSAEVAAIRLA